MDRIELQFVKRLTKVISNDPQLFAYLLIESCGDMTVFVSEFRKNVIDELKIESGRKKSE